MRPCDLCLKGPLRTLSPICFMQKKRNADSQSLCKVDDVILEPEQHWLFQCRSLQQTYFKRRTNTHQTDSARSLLFLMCIAYVMTQLCFMAVI